MTGGLQDVSSLMRSLDEVQRSSENEESQHTGFGDPSLGSKILLEDDESIGMSALGKKRTVDQGTVSVGHIKMPVLQIPNPHVNPHNQETMTSPPVVYDSFITASSGSLFVERSWSEDSGLTERPWRDSLGRYSSFSLSNDSLANNSRGSLPPSDCGTPLNHNRQGTPQNGQYHQQYVPSPRVGGSTTGHTSTASTPQHKMRQYSPSAGAPLPFESLPPPPTSSPVYYNPTYDRHRDISGYSLPQPNGHQSGSGYYITSSQVPPTHPRVIQDEMYISPLHHDAYNTYSYANSSHGIHDPYAHSPYNWMNASPKTQPRQHPIKASSPTTNPPYMQSSRRQHQQYPSQHISPTMRHPSYNTNGLPSMGNTNLPYVMDSSYTEESPVDERRSALHYPNNTSDYSQSTIPHTGIYDSSSISSGGFPPRYPCMPMYPNSSPHAGSPSSNHKLHQLPHSQHDSTNSSPTVNSNIAHSLAIQSYYTNTSTIHGNVYCVQFRSTTRFYTLHPSISEDIPIGTFVVVEADRGEDVGIVTNVLTKQYYLDNYVTVALAAASVEGEGSIAANGALLNILRRASSTDCAGLPAKLCDEETILSICRELVYNSYKLPMVIDDADFQFDRRKVTVCYSSEDRVDFRCLVRYLFTTFKVRIWMKKVTPSKIPLQQWATTALSTGVAPKVIPPSVALSAKSR